LCTYFKKKVTINYYWPNESDWTFHYEDPQTIISQQDYLLSRMHNYGYNPVEINNHFNCQDWTPIPNKQLHSNIEGDEGYKVLHSINTWLFREEFLNVPVHENLVVVWRTKFIDSKYPSFKDSYDSAYWDLIIPILKTLGYNVLEITHRTPISEVFYLISRCKFIVAYNGMYHYIAKNLIKPMVVMGDSSIIRTHNPQATHFYNPNEDPSPRSLLDYLLNIKVNLVEMEQKVKDIKTHLYPVIYGKPYE